MISLTRRATSSLPSDPTPSRRSWPWSSPHQAVGQVELDAGGVEAPRQQAAREGLRLAVVDDLELGPLGTAGDTLATARSQNLLELLLELGWDTSGESRRPSRPRSARRGVGVVEGQAALHQVVGHHAAQEGASRSVTRPDPQSTAAAAFRLRCVARSACQRKSRYQRGHAEMRPQRPWPAGRPNLPCRSPRRRLRAAPRSSP